jgi:hypothetical protein
MIVFVLCMVMLRRGRAPTRDSAVLAHVEIPRAAFMVTVLMGPIFSFRAWRVAGMTRVTDLSFHASVTNGISASDAVLMISVIRRRLSTSSAHKVMMPHVYGYEE